MAQAAGIPCSLDGRQVTPQTQSPPSWNEKNCTGSSFFPFQKELFSSSSSSVALWAPKRQCRNDTTCGKMKQVNLFQNTALTVSQVWWGAHGEELYLQSGWSLNMLPEKYKFPGRKSKSSCLRQPAHSQLQTSHAFRCWRQRESLRIRDLSKTCPKKEPNLPLLQCSKTFFTLTSICLWT